MARFRDLPIRRKLTVANVVTTGVALLLASAAFVSFDIINFRQRLVRQQSTQAEIVGYNVASALLFKDREAATKTLGALRAETQVVAAAVFDPEGTLFAMYRRDDQDIGGNLNAPVSGNGHIFLNEHLLVQREIVVDGELVGNVRLLSSLQELTATILRHLAIGAMVFLMAIGASFPVLARVRRIIARPIMDLVAKARVVTEQKDYSVRATATTGDELGLLVRTFNEMLSQIQKRDRDLERARDEAESANRAKDEFLAVVSHELRTPLSPVLAWARMLRSGQLDAERTARALEVIERNVKSQGQIIEDLLDVSRIISGKFRIEMRPIDLIPVVEAAVESVRPSADAKGVNLRLQAPPEHLVVAGDTERIKQIIWNLLSNAIKFTARGGQVQVAVRAASQQVQVVVTDDGKGIEPQFLPFVFDRFRQADSTSTRAHGGLGLGLSIVRHLVELHGGSVQADSDGEGKGATFTVELPLVAAQPVSDERPLRAGAEREEADLEGMRILAVDDDLDTLEGLRAMLEQKGARIRTATSAALGLRALDEWLPDVIVSDIGMPGEDGYSFIRKVRARDAERGGQIPALALTAYARNEDRLKVLAAGFQMHVPKPIEPFELIYVLSSLVDWSRRDHHLHPRSSA